MIDVASKLRQMLPSWEIFDDWYSPGPEADDFWKTYEQGRGRSYSEALKGYAARHIFEFDKHHIDSADAGILVCPAGKSGHLELGYMIGQGKPGYILLNPDERKLPVDWYWLAGIYEGEGSVTVNNTTTTKNLQMSVTSTDLDVIQRLYKVSGVGHVQGPYFNKGNNLIKKGDFKPQWRWAVYKKADILFVVNGMWESLGERRKLQIQTMMEKVGFTIEDLNQAETPWENRWDVMALFAKIVTSDINEIIEDLRTE